LPLINFLEVFDLEYDNIVLCSAVQEDIKRSYFWEFRQKMDLSQNGEFKVLSKMIDKNTPKFLVDVGANDSKTLSNSFPFIVDGWRAIMIEANPHVYERLKNNLKDYDSATLMNIACSDQEGNGELFLGRDGLEGLLSTLCKERNSWFDYARTKTKIKVNVSTLNSILRSVNFPSDFSILMIDTEGMDFEVLKGLDFSKYSPRIIITEEYLHNAKKHRNKYALLEKNGYTCKHKIGSNTIWAKRQIYGSESIQDHLREIEHTIKYYFSHTTNLPLNFEEFKAEFNLNKYKIDLIKSPRWNDDALLCRISPLNNQLSYKLAIKMHENKYPLADHIYNNKKLLRAVSLSGAATNIVSTRTFRNEGIQFRGTIYDYIEGRSLGSLLSTADEEKIIKLRTSLKKCVMRLLDEGVNVFVRDLDDFIAKEINGDYRILLTDYNATMDCSRSKKYSRKKIMDVISPIIDKLITKDYKPFISQRPTLSNLPTGNDFRF